MVKGAGIGQQDFVLRGDRTWQNPSLLPLTTATTTAINGAVANLVATSPSTLDTLNKIINFTTPATQGGFIQFAHGLDISKIVSINLMVAWSSGLWIPMNYTVNAGRQFQWDAGNSTTISVINISGNSANILSRPGRAFIIYTP